MNKKLGRPTDQRMAVIRNQTSELLWYGRIETTRARAKSVRSEAEKIITLAIKTYQDEIKVKKTKTDAKGNKSEVEFTNDGPKKLAARRRIMATLVDIPEVKKDKESKKNFTARIKDIQNPLVEKIFTEYAPKYDKRAQDKGIGGGYTRIINKDVRRGDAAEIVILELI
ncbi:MAG: 50S ribosomal protein L17 [Clostridia bacterium]|nr:50S ribosomal protein L17 [Clostridia bacterium]